MASVLNQPYKNISIVLVDDGSTDGSGQMCDELAAANDRITVLHQENAGVSAARNTGIEYALKQESGGYLAFLDADDAWTESLFDEKTVSLLSCGYSLIGFQSCDCDKNLRPYRTAKEMTTGLHSGGQDSVWMHAAQHFGAMLYSSDLLQKENVRFFEEVRYSEDKMFSMQCMYLADTVWLENRLMYLYRHAGDSAMSRRPHGIPYFIPILNGYLKLDDMMRLRVHGKPLREARVITSIFAMEMIAEHYQIFRPKREIDRFLADHPNYASLLKAEGVYSNLVPNSEYKFYESHAVMYILKNNFIGGIKLCKKVIRKGWNLIR